VRHRARRGAGHGGGSQDRWLISYADFITLLFAFFTVMYAVSTVDAGKVAPAAASIQEAFSGGPAGSTGAPGVRPGSDQGLTPRAAAPVLAPPNPPIERPSVPADLDVDAVRRRLAAELADAVANGRLEISSDARGLVLSLPVEATFATGSAEVHPEARALVARIGATVKPFGNALRIEGHTDDLPIRTVQYQSNWELSTARASAVVAYLIGAAQLEPGRLSAAGYAEFHPRVPNDSAANRARNRRVDIVVLNTAAAREEPSGARVSP
jgi:chemotaxis protein MotB